HLAFVVPGLGLRLPAEASRLALSQPIAEPQRHDGKHDRRHDDCRREYDAPARGDVAADGFSAFRHWDETLLPVAMRVKKVAPRADRQFSEEWAKTRAVRTGRLFS